MTDASLLSIDGLSVRIHGRDGQVQALSDVDLRVERGEVVGLVGESGGGKSMVAKAVVALLPRRAQPSGQVRVDGADVLAMDEDTLRRHRGGGAAMCFQNPRGALAPVRTIGQQVADRLRAHRGLEGHAAQREAVALLDSVGIDEARRGAYPHELSGGQAQRVMIALALACDPKLLLADEPTTGLDVTLTEGILGLLRGIADTQDRGVLLISHDLASIAGVCDRLIVLYAGTVVEAGPTEMLLQSPAHHYTRALLASVPDLEGVPVVPTPGTMPLLRAAPDACPFAPRCDHADDECRQARPPLEPVSDRHGGRRAGQRGAGDHLAACVHPLPVPPTTSPTPTIPSSVPLSPPSGADDADAPVVDVQGIDVVYRSRFGRGGHQALHAVTLQVAAGETVGVVGESGSGKSTLARVIMGLIPVTAGSVNVGGVDLARRPSRSFYARAQMVFQDPIGALSPRRTVHQAIAEPLEAAGLSTAEQDERIATVLRRVGLDATMGARRPHQLSGGQAQRVGIARALAVDPQVVVFDEPTSALDVTVQAQILDLVAELARDGARAYLLISHDLATVRSSCDRVVVLHRGRIVEAGATEAVFTAPQHPHTRALLASVPRLPPSAHPQPGHSTPVRKA